MNIELDIISYQHVCTFNIMNYTSMICGYGMFSFHRDVTYQTWSGGESTIELYLPLWKIWKSIGMMTLPIYGKKHVPNHQPDMYMYKKKTSKRNFI